MKPRYGYSSLPVESLVYEQLECQSDYYELKSDKTPEVHFNGKLMACVSSEEEGITRWTELELYCTPKNKYICHTVGGTVIDGEVKRYNTVVCNGIPEVIEHFGQGYLAKELYRRASIKNAIYVE